MVGHQAIGEHLDAPQGMGVPYHLEETLVILWPSKYGLTSHSAIHHVVNGTGILNAEWASHSVRLYHDDAKLATKDLTP